MILFSILDALSQRFITNLYLNHVASKLTAFFLEQLLVFEDLAVPSHKTKNVVNYVSLMENAKKVLLVDGGDIDNQLKLATRNLHYVNVLPSIVSN